jgi:hypothetical protein
MGHADLLGFGIGDFATCLDQIEERNATAFHHDSSARRCGRRTNRSQTR